MVHIYRRDILSSNVTINGRIDQENYIPRIRGLIRVCIGREDNGVSHN